MYHGQLNGNMDVNIPQLSMDILALMVPLTCQKVR